MMLSLFQDPVLYLYIVPAAIIAIVFHEVAHGFISYKLGDPTAKKQGRLSLNPIHHLDLMGTLFLIFFRFGWAKPVPVDPRYYRNKKMGMVLVALAGPVMNFIVAFIAALFSGILSKYGPTPLSGIWEHISTFLLILILINLGLGIFNLIPIPPLDGSKILGAILPEDAYFRYMEFERFGFIALLALLYFNVLDVILFGLRDQAIHIIFTIVDWII